jgi:hypothetical protein
MVRPSITYHQTTQTKGRQIMSDFLGTAVVVAAIGAWLTHIFTCLADGSIGLLVAGALMFPIGIIHGFGLWFGIF